MNEERRFGKAGREEGKGEEIRAQKYRKATSPQL